jgi:hypothetical protein
MKSILPWLVCWARRAGTRNFYIALAALAQYKIFFPHHTLFRFMCPHRPATWAGNHAWPPVCKCVSLGTPMPLTLFELELAKKGKILLKLEFALTKDTY